MARTAGDALTALFPLKGAEEEAAARALAAAACMQGYMTAHPRHVTPYGEFAVTAIWQILCKPWLPNMSSNRSWT